MLTRTRFVSMALLLTATTATSCKADKSRPRLEPADAAPEVEGKKPIASGGAKDAPATADAGAEAPPSEPATEPADPPPAEPEPKPDEADQPGKGEESGKGEEKGADASKPTNLKVLPRSWSLAKVNDYMKKQVGRGLGVKCLHCHKKGDYAADGNEHKTAARSMIGMTDGLNRQFFRGKRTVTCFTCHLGKEKPAEG
ncbi:MAG TPA: c-type cytochrome [Kofleriaceae bacterium]|nr:c-type cytochrome [Kofleriaceae bacterium]